MNQRILMGMVAMLGSAGLVLAGCGSDDGGNVSLAISVPNAAALSTPTGELVLDDGASVLSITSARIVLGEVKLEKAEGACDASDDTAGRDDSDCGELELGPFVVDLPLDGSVQTELRAEVPAGRYEEIEFELDDVEDDAALLADFPELEDVTVEVVGTYNGEDFVFLSDFDAEQEIEFEPPLVIEEGGNDVALTLSIDVATWFVDSNGANIDPRTANADGANEELVEDNIEMSFDGFEDEDGDGEDDDDDDDDDDE